LVLKRDEIINKLFNIFIRKDYVDYVVDFYKITPKENRDFNDLVFPLVKRDGDTIWVSQKVTLKKAPHGEIIGYSASCKRYYFGQKLRD